MVGAISSLENAEFFGIYTHYGATYHCCGANEIKNCAGEAWSKLVDLAER